MVQQWEYSSTIIFTVEEKEKNCQRLCESMFFVRKLYDILLNILWYYYYID